MPVISLIGLAALVSLPGCATTERPPEPNQEPSQAALLEPLFAERTSQRSISQDYRIGAGDRLEVSVFGVDELSGKYTVANDGSIEFSLIGSVPAASKTETELADMLSKRLSLDYVRSPQVTVTVTEFRGQKVSVLGAVEKPGFYPLHRERETIMDVLNSAGGISANAGTKIYFSPAGTTNAGLQRVATAESFGLSATPEMISSDQRQVEINLTELYEGRSVPALNLPVRDGDTVLVPEGQEVYLDGWVEKPGPYKLERGMTLTQVIIKAGGLHFAAAPSRVTLSREDHQNRHQDYRLNYSDLAKGREREIYLQDGDRIRVGANPAKAYVWAWYSFLSSVVRLFAGGGIAAF